MSVPVIPEIGLANLPADQLADQLAAIVGQRRVLRRTG